MIMKQISYLVTLALLVLTFTSHAFKIDTHVYIGQQVIDDLQDGYLTFTLGEERISVLVDEEVKQAILNYPSVYRAGNIGPDSFPDIFSGQTVVHPGMSDGWQTSDWLEYVMSEAKTPREKSFAYGYLGHAASDIFAHTYVNRYAGDMFDLEDNNFDIEVRHILLENFISEKQPDFDEKFALSVPAGFVFDKLFNNETVSSIYGNNDAASHLKWFYDLKQKVHDLQNSETLKELDIEVTKYVVNAATGITISDEIAEKLYKIEEEITRLKKDSIEIAGKIHGELLRIDGQLLELTGKSVDSLIGNLNSAISEAKRANEKYYESRKKIIEIEEKLFDKIIPEKIEKKACEKKTKWIAGIFLGIGGYFTTESVCHNEEITNPLFQAQKELLRAERNIVDKLLTEVNDEIKEVKQIAREIADTLILTQRNYRKIIGEQYSFVSEMYSDPNPIRSFLIMWENNIDRSIEKYFEHTYLAIVETMKPNGKPLPILKEWVECWATGLLSVPTQFTNSACMVEDSYKKISKTLEKVITHINPALMLAQEIKDKIDNEIDRAGKKILMKLIAKLLDDDVLKLMKTVLSSGNTDEKLRLIYSEDNFNSGILLIPDVVERVSAEMHLTQSGKFDPNKYPVIYNAIVMTKLTLLSHSQLNELVINAGINAPTLYGDTLYPEYDDGNILFKAIKSIDGNHQWSEYAPQPPYRQGYQGSKNNNELQFGFGFDSYSGTGIRVWQDQKVRDRLFRKIFIGPLVPGVDAPDIIGFSRINAMVNNYHTCIERPFPDGDNDKACTKPKVTHESSPQIVAYIDKCLNKFSSFFGAKVGSIYVCFDDSYYCQDTTGVNSSIKVTGIAIHNSKQELIFELNNDWYYGDLSLCD